MKKRIFVLTLVLTMCLGLGVSASATDVEELTAEDVEKTVVWTYTVGDEEFDRNNAIEVKKGGKYFRYVREGGPTAPLKQVETEFEEYYAVREDSVFTVKHTGAVTGDSYIAIYMTAYIDTGDGMYQPEWSCRQWLTEKGFNDETINPSMFGGLQLPEAGESVQFKLNLPVLYQIGASEYTQDDIIYELQLDFCHVDLGELWSVISLFKVDEDAINAYVADNQNNDTSPSTPESPVASTTSATPTASTVLVNGEKKAFDAYNIEGNNYFKLRDLAYVLSGTDKQFEVGWDAAANAISLTSGKAYTAVGGEMVTQGNPIQANAILSDSKILLDGKEISLTAYTINGNNYFKLRDLGQTFDFGVGWNGEAQTISIDTAAGYTAE